MRKKEITSGLSLLFLLAVTGCLGPKPCGISGYVYTSDNTAHSYILHGSCVDPNYTPVPGARIYLSLDQEGQDIVRGCEAESDAVGRNHIDTKECPPPRDPDGYYYIFVKKEGYEQFSHRITDGPLAPFRENRVVLPILPKP